MRLRNLVIASALALTSVVGCSSSDSSTSSSSGSSGAGSSGSSGAAASADIVDTAVAAKFTKLAAALTAADLVATLKGPGPFTVFAPTDAAFEKLPAGTLDNLLKPENKAQLAKVLTYHVVSGNVKAADVVKLTSATTVQGGAVKITVSGSSVKLNDTVSVTQTDVAASNGTIHIIDGVLLPPE